MNNSFEWRKLQISRLANVEFNQVPLNSEFLRNIAKFIGFTQPRVPKMPLVRIGQNSDGGYVIAPIFDSKICVNLGVGFEISADLALLDNGFKIYAFDGTVPNPLPEQNSYLFTQKNIGYASEYEKLTTLEEIFKEPEVINTCDLILMDIEGHEHFVMKNEMDYLTRSTQLVIEFHGLELLADKDFALGLNTALEKLSQTHYPIHVHANNAGGSIPVGGGSWPTILEVTFLQKNSVMRLLILDLFQLLLIIQILTKGQIFF